MVKRRRRPSGLSRPLLAGASALVAAAGLGLPGGVEGPASPPTVQGPSRLAPPSPSVLLSGRALLFDEADDPSARSAISAELQRISVELFARDGWRAPFDEGAPLRVSIARRTTLGAPQAASQWTGGGRLAGASIVLDGTRLTAPQIARELTRQIVRATLSAYGAPEDAFLAPAVIEALSGGLEDASGGGPEAALEDEAWILAAAPTLEFRRRPDVLGRLFVEEILRDRGDSALLRLVWERAGASAESPSSILARMLVEAPGPREETYLLRAAARLYAAVEPEAAPSRLRRLDLEAGSLDSAPPAELSVRHRTFLPEDSAEDLRIGWPEDAGSGAAVVRYRDATLPPDVVLFAPGDVRRIPLSGVSRIDWVIAGAAAGGREIQAPATCEFTAPRVFTGLEARAFAGPERPRLTWKTATHDGLWGWAVFREELRADGRVARTGPEIVPSSERSEESLGYVFVDTRAISGTWYRYTVWAVTDEGLLARGFAATLRAGE